MINVDQLALLAPPSGEGTVALRTSLFLDLLAELKELRRCLVQTTLEPVGPTSLTPEDIKDLAAIRRTAEAGDELLAVSLIHVYYHDADRSDRTPREVLLLHLGLVVEAMHR